MQTLTERTLFAENRQLRTQRDALLEMCRALLGTVDRALNGGASVGTWVEDQVRADNARAAIAAAERSES